MSLEREIRAALELAHRGEVGRGFAATWAAAARAAAARVPSSSPLPGRGSPRLALAFSLALILWTTWLALPDHRRESPGELSALGHLSGPTDFLLAERPFHSPTSFLLSSPAEPLLSGLPSFADHPSPSKGSNP